MAKIRKRGGWKTVWHMLGMTEKYQIKGGNFDEWIKLSRKRLMRIYLQDLDKERYKKQRNFRVETSESNINTKMYEVLEIKFPQYESDEFHGYYTFIRCLTDVLVRDGLYFDLTVSGFHSIPEIYQKTLVQVNWFLSLYKSNDYNYLNKIIDCLNTHMINYDEKEADYHDYNANKNYRILVEDLTKVASKAQLDEELKTQPIKKKVSKI